MKRDSKEVVEAENLRLANDPAFKRVVAEEERRILDQIKKAKIEDIDFHANMLQLCDDIRALDRITSRLGLSGQTLKLVRGDE